MKPTETPTFGSTIKEARITQGLSLRETADRAQISKSLLDFWEQDRVSSPEFAKLQRLASVLGLEVTTVAELAGYRIDSVLPPVLPYLRSKYPNLPPGAAAQIAAITKTYGYDPGSPGPLPGEDER